MKKIIYIAFAAASLAAVSCAKTAEFDKTLVAGEQTLTLNFTTGSMATRAVDGVDNENLVKQIDYFFFPYGTDGKVDPNAEYVYKGTLVPEAGHERDITYRETISPGILNKIFPDGNTKAVVMAIANYVGKYGPTANEPETTIPEDAKTWKQLHELEVGPTFFKDGGPGFQLRWPRRLMPNDPSLFFVMAADSVEVELNKAGQYAIDKEVPLKRLASKVTVNFTYEECLEEKKNKEGEIIDYIHWIPQSEDEETRVYLSNGIEHTTIGGPLTRDLVADSWGTATQPLGNGTRDIFEYAYDFMKDIAEVDGKKAAHYYTYPISTEEGDDNQPYLKLVLPWYGYKYVGPETETAPVYSADSPNWIKYKQKEVYYKIVLPRETISEPNYIYEYDVLVNIIGNDKEVQITGEEYRVKDWSSDQAIDNNVGLGRYISLDIPKDTYDMYGDRVQILYVSSGEVEISQLHIYKPNVNGDPNKATNDIVLQKDDEGNLVYGTYSTRTGDGTTNNPYRYGTANYSANTADADGVTVPNWVSVSGTQLIINHAMNTNINNSGVDITPYKFEVTLHLKGETSTRFDRTVTVTQYPPIYAESLYSSSSSTVFLNGQQYTVGTNTTVYNNAGESLGTIGLQGASQTANTRTIVTVSTLSELDVTRYTALGIGTPIIGDPRITLSEKYPVNPAVDAQSWEQNDLGTEANNYIADYQYAALDKSNVIAPKFMLSSGYGSCAGTKVDWIHNVERCASYQEDGYPAGRWRLPTEAEIVFVYNLAHDLGLLSNPFYSTSNYWANSGRRYYNGSFQPAGTGNYSARCVYDLWYWGDEPALTGTAATQWSGFMTSK